jgi:osmoprotectant transport system ATP-binding protein
LTGASGASGATAARGASVRIRGLTVRYPGSAAAALDGVDLELATGEFAVVLGPSGCGKSTLLRTINRLVEPDEGSIEIDGRNVRDVDAVALRRGIGYVIQAIGLFPHMSVAENVAIVPELLGWSRGEIAARVDELLALVSLDPKIYRDRRPEELSGGQQQRVGVARALAARPALLLMDEPFGAVDAVVRTSLQDELREIQRTLGTTILFVTHDVDEALRLAGRLVVMSAGRIVQDAAPLETLVHPATPYVAALLETGDVLRRADLLPVRLAARPNAAAGQGSIAAELPLRDALNALLAGADRLDVLEDGKRIGSLAFEDVRRALGANGKG